MGATMMTRENKFLLQLASGSVPNVARGWSFWKKHWKIFSRRRRVILEGGIRAQARVQSFERFYMLVRTVAAIPYASHRKQGLMLCFDGRRGETAPTIILGGLGFLGLGDSYRAIILFCNLNTRLQL